MLRRLLFRFVHKLMEFHQNYQYDIYRSKYALDKSFRFDGNFILLYGDGEIQIGPHTYIGWNSTLNAHSGSKITIGAKCRVSHNVRMYTYSLDPDQDMSVEKLKHKTGNISIGDYSWIGVNVFISPGVTIGKNSVVGANSVVTRDIPDNVIAAGNPAKVIRQKSATNG